MNIFLHRRIMKQLGYIIILILTTCSAVLAQPRGRGEKIHAIKVGYITDKVNLSAAQAEKFWPLYNRYEQEMRNVRIEFMKKYPEARSRDERESRKFIEDNIEFKEERLKLEKKYKNEFLKVISAQQLAELYEAERDFKRMLIQNLKERRARQGVH